MILTLPPVVTFDGLDGQEMARQGDRILLAVRKLRGTSLDAMVDMALDWSAGGARCEDLIDELSAHVCPSNRRDPDVIRQKVAEEARWAAALAPHVARWAAGDIALADLLMQAAEDAFSAPQSFRRCTAAIVSDTQGRRVMFPSPDQSVDMVARADRYARALLTRDPALAAILAMVVVVHAHPFADGNGRISRTLLAAILRWKTGLDMDVPVLALEHLSYPSYLVRVRRAQCLGDWTPITSHILAALNVIATEASTQALTGI